jgi:streptogramin lyase
MPTTSFLRRARITICVIAASALTVPLLGTATATAGERSGGRDRGPAATRVLELPDGFRPEGVTASTGRIFASSLADGQIRALDPRSGSTTLLPGVAGRSLRGMQVDSRTGLLWVTGNDGPAGLVLALNRRTGQVARSWTIGDAGFLNDLVVTTDAVWVTDSQVDRLTRIPLGRGGRLSAEPLRFLPLAKPWPTPAGFRANGIRELPDGTLLLDHSTAGGLWAVSPRTGAVRAVKVSGGPGLTGGDGLELSGKRLWVVRGASQNGIAELRLDRRRGVWTARWVRELTDPTLDVPSTAVLADGRLWAVNARFGVPDPATATYSISGLKVAAHGR